MNLKIISAGAGSGKTYSLTQEMARLLMPKADGSPAEVRASGILATTFTNKAAAELKERVRVKLLEEGLTQEADELGNAMIGTVHAIGVQLLKRFAFEAGVSPDVDIIADEDHQSIFHQSIATILTEEKTLEMERLSDLLGFKKSSSYPKDWRGELRKITEIARANNLGAELLERSKEYSIQSFFGLLPQVSNKSAEAFIKRLEYLLDNTIMEVENNEDGTKKKEALLGTLKRIRKELKIRGHLQWYEWLSIAKSCADAPAKCREAVADLREFALTHDTHPDFHDDLKTFITKIFDLAIDALKEYENYKKSRGLIDYTDMEVMILKLLDNPFVVEVLQDELDLLLVDEFQDTNPIQLKIFLQLTRIAKKSIWVGDPKQSIYGFRGAAPELMEAVMDSVKDNIHVLDRSWRSRYDLVYMVNGLFTEAFTKMPPERVALEVADPFKKELEAPLLETAVQHWVFQCTEGKPPGSPWLERAIAKATAELLEKGLYIRNKADNKIRRLRAGDIAVLCRSNKSCQEIASQLHQQGLKASISRSGLLETPEACLILACLKYILNEQDSLSIAEILLLMEQHPVEKIIEKRLDFLEKIGEKARYEAWTEEGKHISMLNELRRQVQEMSATEILNLLIERFDIRRITAAWGNAQQRFDNIDSMRSMALQYEENCNRLHNAATLGGFLLWLDELGREEKDEQGSGAGADAVNVLTYHKSKGLEWPVVICFDMGKSLQDKVFDVRIVSEGEVDLRDPLAGRLICYWINPYDDLVKNTALMQAIDLHPDRQKIKQDALDEEVRLLYVGFTRARDYLMIPVVPQYRGGNQYTDWLNRVFHHGQSEVPSVDVHSDVCLWSWKGYEIPVKTSIFEFDKEIAGKIVEEEATNYLIEYSGEKFYHSSYLESPTEWFEDEPDGQLKQPVFYCRPIQVPEDVEVDYETLGKMLHLFIRADRTTYTQEMREKTAGLILQQYKLDKALDMPSLLNISNRFHKYLQNLFYDATLESAKLFRYQQGEQFFKGQLDYVLQRENGERILITDVLMPYEEFKKRQKKKVEELSAFFRVAQKALEAQMPLQSGFRQMLHFPLEGRLLMFELPGNAPVESAEPENDIQGSLF